MIDIEADNRTFNDRRRFPTPIFSRYTISGGKRKTIRRFDDKRSHLFVDLYSTRLLVVILAVFLLSCLDAFLTLSLIYDGKAIEANPIMAYFLSYGVLPFTAAKFLITAAALIILCLSKNMRITRIGLPMAVKIYILIVAYEVFLISL